MKSVSYASEGGPLLVADLASAEAWRGMDSDGSVVMVAYEGSGVERLPGHLRTGKKPGPQERKFATNEDADAFAREVTAALERLNPGAKRHLRQKTAFYRGSERAFSVEVRFTSMLDTMNSKSSASVRVLTYDKKRKGQGLFLAQEGGGAGAIALDAGTLVIVKFHAKALAGEALAQALAKVKRPKPKGSIALDGPIFVFDAALSAAALAQANGGATLTAVADRDAKTDLRELRVADQKIAGGALLRLPKGVYGFAYQPEVTLGKVSASVLFLGEAKALRG